MEDNTMTAVSTETTPSDSTTDTYTAESENTEESTVETAEANGEGTTPPETDTDTETATETEDVPEVVEYQYNHHKYTIPASDVPKMLQKKMLLEKKTMPQIDRLRRLAEADGISDLNEFIAKIEAAYDQKEYNSFLDASGGNAEIAKQLQEVAKSKRAEKFKTYEQLSAEEAATEEEALTNRMGAEFAELQKDFPDIKEFKQLPKSVIAEATNSNIPLRYAYTNYLWKDRQKADSVAKSQKKAAEQSVGSMQSTADSANKTDPNVDAFNKAFASAF